MVKMARTVRKRKPTADALIYPFQGEMDLEAVKRGMNLSTSWPVITVAVLGQVREKKPIKEPADRGEYYLAVLMTHKVEGDDAGYLAYHIEHIELVLMREFEAMGKEA